MSTDDHAPDTTEWEARAALLWDAFDEYTEQEFIDAMDRLTEELPDDSALAAYERASAFDSTGRTELAVPLYRQSLATGLDPSKRRQAAIQLASSLRALGHAEESVRLLETEREAASDDLDDAVVAFLALALTDLGREREAVSIALTALAGHLPRYRRSVTSYAASLDSPPSV